MNRRNLIILTVLTLGLKGRLALATKSPEPLNITQYILEQISAGKPVNIPAGNYLIDAVSIKINSGSKLNFSKEAVFKVNASDRSSRCIFLIDGKQDIEITGGVFNAEDDMTEVISILNGAHSISVSEVKCNGCRLLTSDVMKSYDLINDSELNYNININECYGASTKIVTRKAFIELHYIKVCNCFDCNIDGYYHGIMFWGGDANPKRDGVLENLRKVSHLNFKGNTVKNVQLGGIWGSMGEYITIDSNYLEQGRDVGIDFEGCNNSLAINNIIKNFRHGGLATFFLCSDIKFENNTSISTKKENIVAAIFNSTLKQDNRNIQFINNKFIGDGVITVFAQNGTVSELLIQGNIFTNTSIKLTSPNNGAIKISKNNFSFNIMPQKDMPVVNVSNVLNASSYLIIQDNHINSEQKWFTDIPVFHIKTLESRNSELVPIVEGNLVEKVSSPKSAIVSKITQK